MDSLFDQLPQLINAYGDLLLVFIVLLLLLSGFGLPMPEDIPLLVAGVLCHYKGPASLWTVIPLVFAAVLGSDCVLYWIGRRYGHHLHRLPLLRRFLTQERLARAQLAYHNHGGKTLFVGRFLPGLRAAIFFSAGVFKIPFWKLLAFDGSAALVSVPTLVLLGFFFASQVAEIKHRATQVQLAVGVAVILVGVAVVTWKVKRKRKLAAGA